MTKKLDIEFPRDFYLDDVGVWRLKKEKITELEASNVQTNEDWLCDYFNNEFRAMPTEKKAEVISNFILRLKELNCNKLAWMKWLKQPHKGE